MRSPRLILKAENTKNKAFSEGTVITLCGSELHHLRNVLRRGSGDTVQIFEESQKRTFSCIIEAINEEHAELRIQSELPTQTPPNLTLLVGAPKPKIADFIVEKCTEIGVAELCFFRAERTQGRFDTAARIERLNRVALAAVKQSGAGFIPKISVSPSIEQALATQHLRAKPSSGELRLLLDREGENLLLVATEPEMATKSALKPSNLSSQPTDNTNLSKLSCETAVKPAEVLEKAGESADLFLIVGPEGGLTSSECESAKNYSYRAVSVGTHMYRTETAVIVASALTILARESLHS